MTRIGTFLSVAVALMSDYFQRICTLLHYNTQFASGLAIKWFVSKPSSDNDVRPLLIVDLRNTYHKANGQAAANDALIGESTRTCDDGRVQILCSYNSSIPDSHIV